MVTSDASLVRGGMENKITFFSEKENDLRDLIQKLALCER